MALDLKKRLLDGTFGDFVEAIRMVIPTPEKEKAGTLKVPADNGERPFKVYTNDTLKELLGIQDKLIKKYRDDGLLGFSKVGDKFWYTQDDVDKFLMNSHNSAYRYD